jgi:hypothetical protein
LSEWFKTILATLVGGVLGMGSTLLVEHYYRPAQLRTQIQAELFRATYDKRIESYQAILQMFSDVYWLEREATSKPETKRESQLELIQNVQRQIIRAMPIIDQKAYSLAFDALDYYIQHSNNFTPEVRKKWIDLHVNPLVDAIRKDLHQDEIVRGVGESIFQIAPSKPK